MLDLLIHVWSKPNKTAIACLCLAPLVISCGATDVTDPFSDTVASSVSEETVVAEEPIAPQPDQTSSTDIAQNAGEDTNNLLIDLEGIDGMQYADARALLLQKGWVPVEAPDPGPYGVERMAYDAGFTEVSACAGTGAGQCSFEFIHPGEQQSLSVITYGGSELRVGDWNIQPSSSVEATTPTDSSPVAQVQSAIPVQFQGKWDGLELCDIPVSDGRLRIGPNRISFYETSATVLEVVTKGDLEMIVTVEYSSEGETWTGTDSFQLSSDRSTLTHSTTNVVRYRCPS